MNSSRRWWTRATDALLIAAVCGAQAATAAGTVSGEVPLFASTPNPRGVLNAGASAPPPARDRAHAQVPRGTQPHEAVLEARVNGVLLEDAVIVVVMPDGTLLISPEDADRLRLRYDAAHLIKRGEQQMLPLPSVLGLGVTLDEHRGTLSLQASPAALTTTSLSLEPPPVPQPNEHGLGGFINYDVLAQRSSVASTDGAQIQLGLFDGFGILTSEHAFTQGTTDTAVRLQTTLRKDFPKDLTTLRFGDFTSFPGSAGAASLIGGVQYGTNFSLQPSLVVFPFQNLAGEAALPSTVQVFVNGALRDSLDVPPGPFQLSQIPVVTGAGNLQMIVTDSLGRSVVVDQPFFASARMLRPGLREYSYEAGWLREDFGIASDHYGRPVGVTTQRWGMTDALTGELRIEALSDQQSASGGLAILTGAHAVTLVTLGYGRDALGSGGHAVLGYQGQWSAFSLGAELAATQLGYIQLGMVSGSPPPTSSASVTMGYFSQGLGSFGLALVQAKARVGADTAVANLSYSRQVGSLGHLSLSLFSDFEDASRRGAALTFTMPFGSRTSAAASITQTGSDDPHLALQAQRSLQREPGLGWRVQANDVGDGGGELDWQGDYGVVRGGADRAGSDTRSFLGAAGGIAWFDGGLFPSRRIENAFGVVRVGNLPGVRVYFDNQLMGTTDADGEYLLPSLRPYQTNVVSIDPEDLPLDAVVSRSQMTSVPYQGSGVLIEFPARIDHGVTLTLVRADGRPIPAGATVKAGSGEPAPVGDAGFVFVGLQPGPNTLEASWGDSKCTASVVLPTDAETLADLGRVTCKSAGER